MVIKLRKTTLAMRGGRDTFLRKRTRRVRDQGGRATVHGTGLPARAGRQHRLINGDGYRRKPAVVA
jgi:hypothetical protein